MREAKSLRRKAELGQRTKTFEEMVAVAIVGRRSAHHTADEGVLYNSRQGFLNTRAITLGRKSRHFWNAEVLAAASCCVFAVIPTDLCEIKLGAQRIDVSKENQMQGVIFEVEDSVDITVPQGGPATKNCTGSCSPSSAMAV